jgi:putative membrane protein
MRWIIHWLVNAASLAIVVYLVPGFHVSGIAALLIAALVLGIVNATIGTFLKVITFPLTVLTFGIFWLVINALMIELVGKLVPGFYVLGFRAAFIGAIVLALVNTLLRWLMPKPESARA